MQETKDILQNYDFKQKGALLNVLLHTDPILTVESQFGYENGRIVYFDGIFKRYVLHIDDDIDNFKISSNDLSGSTFIEKVIPGSNVAFTLNNSGSSETLTIDVTSITHSSTHIEGGNDEIDTDKLNVDFIPSNYIPISGTTSSTVTQLASHLKGIDSLLTNVDSENFYLERIETIDNVNETVIEYFTFVQNSTEISNIVNVFGGTYKIELNIIGRNTSNNGTLNIDLQIGTTSVFSEVLKIEPKDGTNQYYLSLNKRFVLSSGNNTINLNFSNIGNGTSRIYEANIEIKKI